MTSKQRKNFERLLNPRHIAFVGGGDAIIAIGEARRRGFKGTYWAVNPKRETLAGVDCVASVSELPEAPDAVFLAVPAAAAIQTVQELADMGTGGIVCYTAGFKESGEEGVEAEKALKAAVGDMALIGPNCYGMINYLDDVALWPFAHGGSSPGYGAAVITQSGMFSSDITMSQRSLPLTHMISCGNQTVLGLEDYVDALSENPAVRAIGVHIEGLTDVPAFEAAALKALNLGKPIVALKTGSSEIGSKLTVSHTGSLAGSDALYDALFDRVGVIRVSSPSQMLETLKFLCIVDAPKNRRVAGFTCSGGGATMLADHAATIDLEFPAFEEGDKKDLAQMLPSIATVSNPLDYTTPIWGQPERTEPVFTEACVRLDAGTAVLVQDYPAPGLDESRYLYFNDAKAFAAGAKAAGLPAAICATLPENLDAGTRGELIALGVAPMQGLQETLNAVAAAARWQERRDFILSADRGALHPSESGDAHVLDEAEGKKLVAASGLPVPTGKVLSASEVAVAAEKIGCPVVLKMMGPRLLHKTEMGAVAVNLSDATAVEDACAEMISRVGQCDPTAVTDRFLVEAMADKPLAELIVGFTKDPQFGWSLTLGSGGVLVELIKDVQTVLLPAQKQDLLDALDRLKIAGLLKGFRGSPPVDVDKLADTLMSLCGFVTLGGTEIEEIEIIPRALNFDTGGFPTRLFYDSLVAKENFLWLRRLNYVLIIMPPGFARLCCGVRIPVKSADFWPSRVSMTG